MDEGEVETKAEMEVGDAVASSSSGAVDIIITSSSSSSSAQATSHNSSCADVNTEVPPIQQTEIVKVQVDKDHIHITQGAEEKKSSDEVVSGKDDFYRYKPDYSKMAEDERLLAPVVTKSTSIACWQGAIGLARIIKMQGNMWRKVGFTVNNSNFLYPEEVLYMFEKGSIAVTKTTNGNDFMNKREIYEAVLQVIPISCYLTYCRLKNLDYVVFRHKKAIRSISSVEQLRETIVQNPSLKLVDMLVSFDVYLDEPGFSKKLVKGTLPVSYIAISEKNFMYPPQIFLKLIEEADSVPVIMSAVTSTGFVILEEFTDAEKTLNLCNSRRNAKIIYGRPNMKRIVGKEFFLIQGDEKDEDSYSSEAEEDVGEEEVEVEGEVAVGKGDIATPMDVVSQDEKTLTRDRNEEEDREDLNDRPAKKLKTSHEDSQSTGNTSSSSSFVSKCIIL